MRILYYIKMVFFFEEFLMNKISNYFFARNLQDKFNEEDFENGYSRNLLWRLWHASVALEMDHLRHLCAKVCFISFLRICFKKCE